MVGPENELHSEHKTESELRESCEVKVLHIFHEGLLYGKYL